MSRHWFLQFAAMVRNAFSVLMGDPFVFLLNMATLGGAAVLAITPVFAFGEQTVFIRDQALALTMIGGSLMAAFGAAKIISDDGMAPAVMSRPVSPSALIAGKYVGLVAALTIVLIVGATACLWAIRLVYLENEVETLGLAVYASVVVLTLLALAAKHYKWGGAFARDANLGVTGMFVLAFLCLNFFGYDGGASTGFGALVAWRSLFAYGFIFMGLLVFAALMTAFAVIFDRATLLVFASVMFFLGLLTPYFADFLEWAPLRAVFLTALPDWQLYWVVDRLGTADGISSKRLAFCLFQSLGQALLYVSLGAWLWSRREISGTR